MDEDILNDTKVLLHEAIGAAQAVISDVNFPFTDTENKEDGSIVTASDKAISDAIQSVVGDSVLSPMLVDEESYKQMGATVKELRSPECKDLIISVDPIDGTKAFANGRDEWAVSIGAFYEGEPIAGCVWAPYKSSVRYETVSHISSDSKFKNRPLCKDTYIEIESLAAKEISFMQKNAKEVDLAAFFKKASLTQAKVYSTVVSGMNVWNEYSAALLCKPCIWDIAGIWPLLRLRGVEMLNARTGVMIERIDASLFADNWRMKEPVLFTRPEWFDVIQSTLEFNKSV